MRMVGLDLDHPRKVLLGDVEAAEPFRQQRLVIQ